VLHEALRRSRNRTSLRVADSLTTTFHSPLAASGICGTDGMKAIDLFAGAGGFSTGARMAGVDVVFAANHRPQAVEVHSSNHPATMHACQDLHQLDWSTVPPHDLLMASPACQGHSRARGKE